MKYCQIFKNKLDCNNADDVFNCLINNLKETIKTWDYFVNWDKVIKNYRDVEVSLNLLNTLIGKDDIETAARELLKEYPKVIGVIPALLAYRERKVKLLSDVSKFSITEYDFAKTIDVDKAVMFLKKTGFLRLLSDRNIKSILSKKAKFISIIIRFLLMKIYFALFRTRWKTGNGHLVNYIMVINNTYSPV